MPRDADSPFTDFRLYGPFPHVKDKRMRVQLVHKIHKSRTAMTVARYKMCVHLDRILDTSEEVDHIDDDPLNDDFDNLQILTKSENVRKSGHRIGQSWVQIRCVGCGKSFEKEIRLTHLRTKSKKFTTCGMSCGNTVGHQIRKSGMSDTLRDAIENSVLAEFRKHLDWKQ